MYEAYDDDDTLQALALSDDEFNAEVGTLIQEGLADGDIGYRHWWSIAHNLKMAKMELIFCREAIKQIQEDPKWASEVFAVLDQWKNVPKSKERAEKWLKLLEAEDWDTILAMNSEGLRLRELSPMRFALPEAVSFEITRQYYR
ncbi:MAG TPA: hypothetical protein DCK83_00970 [Gallionellaceae bacterium]|nr:hypothetical protein [Gallionellaceae bacterium]